jgi:hypothetical protein
MQVHTSPLPHSVPLGPPFQQLFGPSPSTQRLLVANGELESFLVGKTRGRRHIIVSSWFTYVERQQQREKAGTIGMGSPNPRAAKRLGSEPQTAAQPKPAHPVASLQGA